jgi:nucleoside 2-deoxyribosyltransferase
MRRHQLYFAAPLFTPQERAFNERLASRLSISFDVFLPQRDGLLLPGKDLDSASYSALAKDVFQADVDAIRRSALIFSILDGRTVDEGVAVELGMAHALGKECIGFLSDARVLLPHGINPMVRGAIQTLLRSEDELHNWLSSIDSQEELA